jgi:hypothetical protein
VTCIGSCYRYVKDTCKQVDRRSNRGYRSVLLGFGSAAGLVPCQTSRYYLDGQAVRLIAGWCGACCAPRVAILGNLTVRDGGGYPRTVVACVHTLPDTTPGLSDFSAALLNDSSFAGRPRSQNFLNHGFCAAVSEYARQSASR